MKKYHVPFITSSIFFMLLGQQPLMAVDESKTLLETIAKNYSEETKKTTLWETDSLFEELSAKATTLDGQQEINIPSTLAMDLDGQQEINIPSTLAMDLDGQQEINIPSTLAMDLDSQQEINIPSTLETDFVHQETEATPEIASDDLFIAQMPTYSPPPGQTYQSPPPQNYPRGTNTNSDVLVPNPDVIIRSNGSSIPDSLQPTMPVAPTLPRAIAPPVGDMAISNIDASGSQVNLGSSAIVPRLVLREAPAREVLAVLARFAGINLVFTDTPGAEAGTEPTVSLDLENEPVQDVFNSVLMISGLQANRRGRTVFVGSRLPQAARNLVSRTLRLNQVKSANAGVFLASQGAEFQRLVTQTEDIIDPLTQRVVGRRELPSSLESLTSAAGDAASGPMLLKGLTVSSDDRLNTVTLVGEPRHVQVATSLLTQMDARRRQVAVNVKVVDVTLTNEQSFSSNWSFGSGDTFVVQDDGAAVLRFGGPGPASSQDLNSAPGRVINPPVINNPLSGSETFINFDRSIVAPGQGGGVVLFDELGNIRRIPSDAIFFGREAAISVDPTVAGITEITPGEPDTFTRSLEIDAFGRAIITTEASAGAIATATSALPSFFQYPKRFLAQIETNIISGNAKILTDPTLVVQEGQEATVKLTQKVVENITTQVDPRAIAFNFC